MFALPGSENVTSFTINAASDPERFPLDTSSPIDEPGTYIATMTVTDPASNFMGMTTPEQKYIFSYV